MHRRDDEEQKQIVYRELDHGDEGMTSRRNADQLLLLFDGMLYDLHSLRNPIGSRYAR